MTRKDLKLIKQLEFLRKYAEVRIIYLRRANNLEEVLKEQEHISEIEKIIEDIKNY